MALKFTKIIEKLYDMRSTIILGALISYLVYHGLQGNRGLFALLEKREEIAKKQVELQETVLKKQALERRIKALQEPLVSVDLLDELARNYFGYAAKDEDIILIDKPE